MFTILTQRNDTLCVFTRETLLGQLSVFIKQTRDNFMQQTNGGGKGIPKGKNVPEAVNNISWVQQLIAKVWKYLPFFQFCITYFSSWYSKFFKKYLHIIPLIGADHFM